MSKPEVAIIMGSQSDWPTMRHAAEILDILGVPHEDRTDGSGQDRDGDGRERWVHGAAGSSSG